MEIQRCRKEAFSVIGKEGSTNEGSDFILRLWADANSHFHEVFELAKKDDNGNLIGLWGAMSDFTHSFHPWEDNFTKGLYLAGVEVNDDALAPQGWVKWTIPPYEFIYIENEGATSFADGIRYLEENNLTLAGAVHDFHNPITGKDYMYFPIHN